MAELRLWLMRGAIQVPWSAISLCHLAAGAGIQRPCFR